MPVLRNANVKQGNEDPCIPEALPEEVMLSRGPGSSYILGRS